MPAGTPEGLLSSLSHIGSIYLKTKPLFPKAGCELSFLLFLLEIFLGFGQLRSWVRLWLWELSYAVPGSGSVCVSAGGCSSSTRTWTQWQHP